MSDRQDENSFWRGVCAEAGICSHKEAFEPLSSQDDTPESLDILLDEQPGDISDRLSTTLHIQPNIELLRDESPDKLLLRTTEEETLDHWGIPIKTDSSLKHFGLGIYNFLRGFVEGHFTLPMYMRKTADFLTTETKSVYNITYMVGGKIPLVGYCFFFAYYPLVYYPLFMFDKKIAASTLLVQLTTNFVSYGYEKYLEEKNGVKDTSFSDILFS